jgi:anhydro-N-acetylmuramic acid kinase
MVLNHLSNFLGIEYDESGVIASMGHHIPEIFEKLNNLEYYRAHHPKSLGREWVSNNLLEVLDINKYSIPDLLNTYVNHIAFQISRIKAGKNSEMLVTGGGAHNNYLVKTISKYFSGKIFKPESQIIDYKEAIIFAFLGYLRLKKQINVLSSVTGASRDSIAGAIYSP